jgi:hypothetical protein
MTQIMSIIVPIPFDEHPNTGADPGGHTRCVPPLKFNTSPNTGKQNTQEVKNTPIAGADPGFQVRGEHIKK